MVGRTHVYEILGPKEDSVRCCNDLADRRIARPKHGCRAQGRAWEPGSTIRLPRILYHLRGHPILSELLLFARELRLKRAYVDLRAFLVSARALYGILLFRSFNACWSVCTIGRIPDVMSSEPDR